MHPGMQVVDQRVRSFAAITKPKSAARPGWPLDPASYPRLTPQQLADAGFYYDPADGIDTCKCFSCGIKLGGWEEGDDPLDEHWARREKCAWAELMCAMYMEKRDGTRSYVHVTHPTARAKILEEPISQPVGEPLLMGQRHCSEIDTAAPVQAVNTDQEQDVWRGW
jgi:hypothetical protein